MEGQFSRQITPRRRNLAGNRSDMTGLRMITARPAAVSTSLPVITPTTYADDIGMDFAAPAQLAPLLAGRAKSLVAGSLVDVGMCSAQREGKCRVNVVQAASVQNNCRDLGHASDLAAGECCIWDCPGGRARSVL